MPKGNRYAVLLSAGRADFGGALAMGLEKLPPGVSIAAEAMDAGQPVVPVVFEAKPDAATGGLLTGITATPTDPKLKVPCKTSFDVAFTLGAPGQTVYSRHHAEKTAAAVTELLRAAPEIDLVVSSDRWTLARSSGRKRADVPWLLVSGYFGDFTLAEARGLLLATHVSGEVLDHWHGFPLRAVAPGISEALIATAAGLAAAIPAAIAYNQFGHRIKELTAQSEECERKIGQLESELTRLKEVPPARPFVPRGSALDNSPGVVAYASESQRNQCKRRSAAALSTAGLFVSVRRASSKRVPSPACRRHWP